MAQMVTKHCSGCGLNTLHNPMALKKGEEQKYRCTYCGTPVSNHPEGKIDQRRKVTADQIKKSQILLGRLV